MTSETLTPDPDALPFLIVHGGWFVIVLVVSLAIVLLGLFALVRHLVARVRCRRWIARLRRDAGRKLVEGPIVLAGRWCCDAVDVGGVQVAFDDRMQIVAGERGGRIQHDASVVVTGQLSRVAVVDREAGYRIDAGTWRLAGARVYATSPHVRARSLGRLSRTVVLLASLLVSYRTLAAVGGTLVDEFESDDGDGLPLEIGEFHSMAIAAALPGSRDEALRRLSKALERHRFRDESSIRRRLALAELGGDRCVRARILVEHGRYDEALAVGGSCGSHFAFETKIALGDYDGAWASRPPDLDSPMREGMVAIASRQWAEAAKLAERVASQKEAPPAILNFRCLAAWFRSLAGDPSAPERLRRLAVGKHAIVCAPMIAQTLAPSARRDFLIETHAHEHDRDDDDFDHHVFVSLEVLRAMRSHETEGAKPTDGLMDAIGGDGVMPFDRLAAIGDGRPLSREWIAPGQVGRFRTLRNAHSVRDTMVFVEILSIVAALEVHRGDFAAARRLADEALAAIRTTGKTWLEREALDVFAAIAVRDGTIELPPPGHADKFVVSLPIRRGEKPERKILAFPQERCDSIFELAVAKAQQGDGTLLARAMQTCSLQERTYTNAVLLGVLPLVEHGRDELADAIAWWSSEPILPPNVFDVVARSAVRRDIARLAGDTAGAERWGRIARRAVAPLDDPDRVLALVLWTD